MDNWMLQPIVQYGFLGFSAVLLGVVIWLIHKLLGALEASNQVVTANTAAIRQLIEMTSDLLKLNRSLHDKIISRPCIAREEN
jgi:hypothetical protein